MAVESIAKTLGTGSGIDLTSLVDQLVTASFENKQATIKRKSDTLTAQVSKLSELKSSISGFASALNSLTGSGALQTQPTSSNSGIVAVTRLPNARLSATSASIEVKQLAQGQVSSSQAFALGSTAPVGTGTLTLSFGTATVSDSTMSAFAPGGGAAVSIEITAEDNSLAGIAKKINATPNAGVTASVLNDGTGARLVLKSATGASQGFTLSGTGNLAQLNVGKDQPSAINTAAQDAQLAVDGVPVKYPVNSISTLIDGVRLDLTAAAPGTRVTIGSSMPTEGIKQAVTDFVATYNEVYKMVKDAVDPIDGPLRGDAAAKNLLRQLKGITLSVLNPAAGATQAKTLADIGVATQRDGTLSVDTAALSKALNNAPALVEAMFAPSAGLTAALSKISTEAVSTKSGLGASETSYGKAQRALDENKDSVLAATEKMRARMTQQFAAMDSKVAVYKSTQSFLENQIKAWNSDN